MEFLKEKWKKQGRTKWKKRPNEDWKSKREEPKIFWLIKSKSWFYQMLNNNIKMKTMIVFKCISFFKFFSFYKEIMRPRKKSKSKQTETWRDVVKKIQCFGEIWIPNTISFRGLLLENWWVALLWSFDPNNSASSRSQWW